jgi:flagellar assembly factor FliW
LKIETTRFGEIRIQKERIIRMPFGVLGFPDQQQFVILEHKTDSPFFWYQSIDEPTLAFVITDPCLFMSDYAVDMHKILRDLSWDPDTERHMLHVYVIVNIPKGAPDKMTANLMGPILLNGITREAAQVVLPDSPYSHNVPLIRENSPA